MDGMGPTETRILLQRYAETLPTACKHPDKQTTHVDRQALLSAFM